MREKEGGGGGGEREGKRRENERLGWAYRQRESVFGEGI